MKFYQWFWNDGKYSRFERGFLEAADMAEAYAAVLSEFGMGGATVVELKVMEVR